MKKIVLGALALLSEATAMLDGGTGYEVEDGLLGIGKYALYEMSRNLDEAAIKTLIGIGQEMYNMKGWNDSALVRGFAGRETGRLINGLLTFMNCDPCDEYGRHRENKPMRKNEFCARLRQLTLGQLTYKGHNGKSLIDYIVLFVLRTDSASGWYGVKIKGVLIAILDAQQAAFWEALFSSHRGLAEAVKTYFDKSNPWWELAAKYGTN
jgi:hypothetical protein